MAGATQTFNLWVDNAAPTTSIQEAVPTWFTSTPTLHLLCADNPVAPAENSGCGTTRYCLGVGCTPDTNYNPATGITISSTNTLVFRTNDNVGNPEPPNSRLIQVDTTPPSTVAVTDGGAYTKSMTTLTAAWTASADAESGIALYQYAVGTTSGGTDVRSFTDVGVVTSASITGLTLLSGNTYYITVRAKNGAGVFSTPASSDGITIDISGPAGINTLSVERVYGNYISGTYSISTAALTDAAGIDTTSCDYTVDDAMWLDAVWDNTANKCRKTGLTCAGDQEVKLKMRVSDVLGTVSATSSAVTKTCDAAHPELQSFVPASGTTLSTATKDAAFSTTARDMKSGLDKLEWTLYKNGAPASDVLQTDCEGAPDGGSATCNVKVSDFKLGGVSVNPSTLKSGDNLFVRVRADDHIDPWSPTGDSGQWSIDETAPGISTIAPTLATLNLQQDYSANVKAAAGRTISSCDLFVNGAKADDMALTAGTTADGTWTGQHIITSPATTFMRARCTDNAGVKGDGVDVQISLSTTTTSDIVPAVVEKLQTANITANYKLSTGAAITGAKCWISSSDYNDPAKGIVGAPLADLNNGYYTLSFTAPSVSGNYGYEVSCAKTGYQTTPIASTFTVRGCDGPVCIKVTPSKTAAILSLGEPYAVNLILKNRDDFARTYTISLSNPDPKVFVDITPTQVTLGNGEEKAVKVELTSLAVTDIQIIQNIVVQNKDPLKAADVATSEISAAIAVSSVPAGLEIAAIFVFAAVIIYNKSGRDNKGKTGTKTRFLLVGRSLGRLIMKTF